MCLRPNTIKKIVSCRSPSLRDVRLHPQPPTQQTQPVIQHTHVAVTPNSWPLVKVQCIGIHALWPGVISTLFNTQWSIHAQHHIPTPCDAHKPKERKKGKVCITLIKKKNRPTVRWEFIKCVYNCTWNVFFEELSRWEGWYGNVCLHPSLLLKPATERHSECFP